MENDSTGLGYHITGVTYNSSESNNFFVSQSESASKRQHPFPVAAPPNPNNVKYSASPLDSTVFLRSSFPPPPHNLHPTVPFSSVSSSPQFPPPPSGSPPDFGLPLNVAGAALTSSSQQLSAPSLPPSSAKIQECNTASQTISGQLMAPSANENHTTNESQTNNNIKPEQSNDPIEKARAIARRFHEESTQRSAAGTDSIVFDSSIPADNSYDHKRREYFTKERIKLDKFRLKNLEYVIKHDEMELRRHVDGMNQITSFEEKQSIQLEYAKQQQIERQMKLEQRGQHTTQTIMMNASGGGIGSKDQQRAERVRKRQCIERGTSHVKNSNDVPAGRRRNSLYITNLPTDGSTTERILHSLFSSYGRLDRVTMYRHRSTGDLKGDGLIVFGRDALEAYDKTGADGDLIDNVCMQVSKPMHSAWQRKWNSLTLKILFA